jgi:hypothetical protein
MIDAYRATGCLIKHDTLLKLNSIKTIHQNLISSEYYVPETCPFMLHSLKLVSALYAPNNRLVTFR